jgi:hypothetical protein
MVQPSAAAPMGRVMQLSPATDEKKMDVVERAFAEAFATCQIQRAAPDHDIRLNRLVAAGDADAAPLARSDDLHAANRHRRSHDGSDRMRAMIDDEGAA